jgi:pyruvate/2-oxoglutarate dehydrogenase complex dihydrolipoamide acyltransferase (E2) component
MQAQAKAGRRHTAFLLLSYVVDPAVAAPWDGVGSQALATELQRFWRDQEVGDKALGRASYDSSKFPAVLNGVSDDETIQQQQAEAAAVPPSPAAGMAAAVPPSPAPAAAATAAAAATPSGSSQAAPYASSVSYQEGVQLRAELDSLMVQLMQLRGKSEGLERRNARLEGEIDVLQDEKRQVAAELDVLRQQAAAGTGPQQRRGAVGGAEAGSGAGGKDDAAPEAAVGFPLWALVLVAALAFLLGRLAASM